MNLLKRSVLSLSTLLVLCFHFDHTSAQSQEDAINIFNEGFELFNEAGDYLGAIEKFKKTIEIAEQVGSEADDIRQRAVGQIPRLAFLHAAQMVNQRKLVEAIDAFQEAARLAEKYEDSSIAERSRGNLPRLYLNIGNQYYRQENNEEALKQYKKAIELNPSYISAYYQAGLVYRRKGELDKALEYFDSSIDIAKKSDDIDNVERSQRAARDYLVFLASNQIEEENYRQALDLLEKASEYGESASMYYRFAEAHNFLWQYEQALDNAQKALNLEDGGRTAQARIYFELGLAHMGLDNKKEACAALENALVGDFRNTAEHLMKHELNCE